MNLTIANTWFRKIDECLITYKSEVTCSQIDFFLIRKFDRKTCLDCKVISGESVTLQHRFLVMGVRNNGRAKRRSHMVAPRIKWWHLKGESREFPNTKSWRQGLYKHKEVKSICGIRWPKRLEK